MSEDDKFEMHPDQFEAVKDDLALIGKHVVEKAHLLNHAQKVPGGAWSVDSMKEMVSSLVNRAIHEAIVDQAMAEQREKDPWLFEKRQKEEMAQEAIETIGPRGVFWEDGSGGEDAALIVPMTYSQMLAIDDLPDIYGKHRADKVLHLIVDAAMHERRLREEAIRRNGGRVGRC